MYFVFVSSNYHFSTIINTPHLNVDMMNGLENTYYDDLNCLKAKRN